MDWGLIQVCEGPHQRVGVFLHLQRQRYGNSPEKAALSLWKACCCGELGKQLLGDLCLCSANCGIADADTNEYVEQLLNAMGHLLQLSATR